MTTVYADWQGTVTADGRVVGKLIPHPFDGWSWRLLSGAHGDGYASRAEALAGLLAHPDSPYRKEQ